VPRARGARVSLLRQISVSHVRVAAFIVNNNPKQWTGAVDHFLQPQVRLAHDPAIVVPADAREAAESRDP
jgi:hypothetical protein